MWEAIKGLFKRQEPSAEFAAVAKDVYVQLHVVVCDTQAEVDKRCGLTPDGKRMHACTYGPVQGKATLVVRRPQGWHDDAAFVWSGHELWHAMTVEHRRG